MNYDKKYSELTKSHEPRDFAKLVLKYIEKSNSKIIDAGCGSGNDSMLFINEGYEVIAIDRETSVIDEKKKNLDKERSQRLTVIKGDFTNINFQKCDLFYSAYSLPFCSPECFESMWRNIVKSINPNGLIAIVLFGENDEWYSENSGKSFHTKAEIEKLLHGFEIILLDSNEYVGTCMNYEGIIINKNWHVYNVIARLSGN